MSEIKDSQQGENKFMSNQGTINLLVALTTALLMVLGMSSWVGSDLDDHELEAAGVFVKVDGTEKDVLEIKRSLVRIEDKIDKLK